MIFFSLCSYPFENGPLAHNIEPLFVGSHTTLYPTADPLDLWDHHFLLGSILNSCIMRCIPSTGANLHFGDKLSKLISFHLRRLSRHTCNLTFPLHLHWLCVVQQEPAYCHQEAPQFNIIPWVVFFEKGNAVFDGLGTHSELRSKSLNVQIFWALLTIFSKSHVNQAKEE